MQIKIPQTIKCGQYRFKIMFGQPPDDAWAIFDGSKRLIVIRKNASRKRQEVALVHELLHLSTWYEEVYSSQLKRVGDAEESLITRIDETFYKLLKQL